ncbi:hypothetical protein HaLaN_32940, partial [Haematococcus lacustris]
MDCTTATSHQPPVMIGTTKAVAEHLCIFTQHCIFHGEPKLLDKATARRTAHRVMAKKKRKGSDKKHKVSRSAQGKQRQDRRDGWTTRRRQVIKVPEGAVLRGCKKTRR